MPTLDELKDKWFIDVSLTGQFPPQTRHPGTLQVKPHTDGNLVEPLIEGATVMADFNDRLNAMISSADPSQWELWIASWRLDPVKLLGQTKPEKDAEAKMLEAVDAGVRIIYLGGAHVGRETDARTFAEQLRQRGSDGAADDRFPLWGSQHSKFFVYHGPANDWSAVVGSVDLSFTRWDTREHLDANPDRSSGPTHDISVSVRGPAVHDVALTFAERWNDTTNRHLTDPRITTTIPTNFLSASLPQAGTHSVQVLRTYAIDNTYGYSWSNQGEFTVWAAYLNAIKQAQQYIYIEDQYFYTFAENPLIGYDLAIEAPAGKLRDSDLVFQLGEALKRGVDVVVLVPSRSEDPGAQYQLYQRGKAAHYLRNIADFHPGPVGRFVICSLKVGSKDPVVHSKLMIVDDEFVLVGSTNIDQRSMSHDSQLHLGIVDAADPTFAFNLRLELWKEHMNLSDTGSIEDPSEGVGNFRDNAVGGLGRLRTFTTTDPGFAPCCHGFVMAHGIDPYSGPARS